MEEDNLEGYTLDSSLIEDENLNLSNIAKYSNDTGDELIESKEDQPKETKPIPVPDEAFVRHTEKSSDTNSRPLSGFKPNYMSSTKASSSTRVVRGKCCLVLIGLIVCSLNSRVIPNEIWHDRVSIG